MVCHGPWGIPGILYNVLVLVFLTWQVDRGQYRMGRSPTTTHLHWDLESFLFADVNYEAGGQSSLSKTYMPLRSPP